MNLIRLVEQFSDENACRKHLTELRWPDGVECLRCESAKVNGPSKRHLYECSECGYQFSVKVGTVFNDSHLPLTKWFLTTHLLCEAKKGMSACQIQRTVETGNCITEYPEVMLSKADTVPRCGLTTAIVKLGHDIQRVSTVSNCRAIVAEPGIVPAYRVQGGGLACSVTSGLKEP